MSNTIKSTILVASFFILILLVFATPIDAQAGSQDLLMTNMKTHAELGMDCDTIILLETEFSNVGSTEFNSFDLRVDVRGLQVNEATINGSIVETTIQSVDNYVIISIFPNSTIPVGTKGNLLKKELDEVLEKFPYED